MSQPDEYTYRSATPLDFPAIRQILVEVGMGEATPEQMLEGHVACAGGQVAGFIRVYHGYVYPVAVAPKWQGQGLGRFLTERALAEQGQLKLVSCTPAQPFYEAMGFSRIPMSEVDPEIAHDCEVCPDRATCTPQAYTKSVQK
ncbi:MAG: GNAT family N-acetyltransferase [Coriobacteriales bacterium]|nr:GNAT family N-acetyltransferase [Coriobacteriales bacterium]